MILGNGDLAQACKPFDKEGITFFCSGVSNSSCTDENEFLRERHLLGQQGRSRHMVYFSTLSIYYANTPYTRHKAEMENRVKSLFNRYTIIRLGNITWGKNPNTLINFLRHQITNKHPYEIKETFRYLCNKDEFKHWISMIPQFNTEMNITGERVSVREIETRIKANLL